MRIETSLVGRSLGNSSVAANLRRRAAVGERAEVTVEL